MTTLSMAARPATVSAIRLVARGVFLETVRRKEFYVLLLLAGLFALGAFVVSLVGIENEATAAFLLNLSMSFAYLAAHILVLLTAARQIPNEIDTRSLYPLLAKPLLREHYLLGKWIAASLTGVLALVALMTIAWIPAPKPADLSGALFAQTVVLHAASLALLAALALLLSLLLPKGVNLILLAILLLGGGSIAAFLRARALDSGLQPLVNWISYYVPDFTRLNLVTRYTDGVTALSGNEFLGLVTHTAIFTAFALLLAILLFRRRPL